VIRTATCDKLREFVGLSSGDKSDTDTVTVSDTDTDMSDVGDIENRTWVYRCRWRDLGSTDRYTSVGHYGRLYAA